MCPRRRARRQSHCRRRVPGYLHLWVQRVYWSQVVLPIVFRAGALYRTRQSRSRTSISYLARLTHPISILLRLQTPAEHCFDIRLREPMSPLRIRYGRTHAARGASQSTRGSSISYSQPEQGQPARCKVLQPMRWLGPFSQAVSQHAAVPAA
jgi:hypothetical protein